MSENRWGATLEIFMNESVPRVSPVCLKCYKTYYAWSDAEDYCTRCGALPLLLRWSFLRSGYANFAA